MSESIPTAQLFVSPQHVRKRLKRDPSDWKAFVEDIRVEGVRDPLKIRKTDRVLNVEGTQRPMWEVVDGQRRLLAALEAGRERVPCEKVHSLKSGLEVAVFSAKVNLLHDDLNPADLADLVRFLLKEDPKRFPTRAAVALELHASPSRVSAWLAQSSLPEDVTEAVGEGRLTQKAAERIAQGFDEDETRREVSRLAQAFSSQRDQVDAVAAVRKDPHLLELPAEDRAIEVRKRIDHAHHESLLDELRAAPTPEPPSCIPEEERKNLIEACERLKREDLRDELMALDAADVTGYARLKSLLHDLTRQATPPRATKRSLAQARHELPHEAEGPPIVPRAAHTDVELVTLEEIQAARGVVARFVAEAELHDGRVLTLDLAKAPGLEVLLERLVVEELRKSGEIAKLLTHERPDDDLVASPEED